MKSAKQVNQPLDPVTVTILPIAEELSAFTKTIPPDLTKWTSLYFKKLYARLDIQRIRLWLDGGGFSDAAAKFEDDLNQFLISFRGWENELRKAGVFGTEQLCELQDTNEKLFWGLKEQLEEIYDKADEIADWLKKLAGIITQKASKSPALEKSEILWQAEAIGYLWQHRDWSIQKIADAVNKSRAALYADPDVGKAIKARNKQKQAPNSPHRGEKNPETGKIEAWND